MIRFFVKFFIRHFVFGWEKFFAILKDSLQETLDSKVLYAMLILSALVMVAVASISFEPQPADKGMEAILDSFPGGQAAGPGGQEPPLRYEMQDFKQTGSSTPWENDFHFNVVVHEHSLAGMQNNQGARGLFEFFVLLDDDENLSPEDRSARRHLRDLFFDAATSRNPDARQQKMTEFIAELTKLAPTVTRAQMEHFIGKQVADHGNLTTESVHLEPAENTPLRFVVATKPKPETRLTWPSKLAVGFGGYTVFEKMPTGPAVYLVEDKFVGGIGAGITMLIATIVTSFYIPNMLRKGTIDFLLAKPIPRWLLLVYKYCGGLIFMLLNTVFVITGIWLILSFRSGIWAPAFLLSIPVFTLQFAIFYAISTLLGVLTRSPIVSILAASFAWVVLFGIGWLHVYADSTRDLDIQALKMPELMDKSVNVANQLLPRYKDLDLLTSMATQRDLIGADSEQIRKAEKPYANITWTQTILVTLLYIALLLAIACWWFASKDY